MVNNQKDFNNEYNKEITEARLKNEDFEEEILLIEDYPNLETLYLRGVDSLNKLILRNLPKLQKGTISDCGVQELVIENCPQIKELKLDDNQITNLDFLKNLPNLTKLNVDDNPNLSSGLEFLPQGIKFSCDNTQLNYQAEENEELENLRKENQDLKESKKNLKKAIQENVVNQLDQLDSKLGKITKKIGRSGSFSQSGDTDELTSMADQVVKNIKGINENLKNELAETKTEIQILEKKLINAQEELEDKQLVLKALKQDLKNSPSDSELKEKVNSYEQKIEELKDKEIKLKEELAGIKGKLEAREDEVHHLREKSLNNFKEIGLVSTDDLPANIYQLSLEFLKNKDYFYLARKNTISNLRTQIQELESNVGKFNNINSATNLIIKFGSFTNSLDQGMIGIIGKGAKMGSEFLSSIYISQQGKQIHLSFQNSDEEISNLQKLDFAYTQLNEALSGNKESDLFGLLDNRYHRIFKVDYKIYDILNHQINIWPDRSLNRERLEQIYSALQTNLTQLDQEIDSEFLKLKHEDQANIRKENQIKLIEQEKESKEIKLKKLVESAREKLKSKWSSDHTKKRNQMLDKFLTTGVIEPILESSAKGKKINLQEIANLQNSLQNLQEQLNNCQLQAQIIVNQNN